MGLSLFAALISVFVDVCSDSVLGACIASTVGCGGNISLAIYPILSQKNLEQICQTPKKWKKVSKKRSETIKSWREAREYGLTYISRIINGSIQAKYGKAHKIAIKLGLIDSNRSCYEVGLGIRSTDLTQMEQWFLSILFNLHKNNFGD